MTTTTTTPTDDRDQYEHARANAKGWYETIRDLYREYRRDYADADERDHWERKEEIEREVREGPLSVQVRSAWYTPGPLDRVEAIRNRHKPIEYEILLTTGGPGLRIWGELTEHGEPDSAHLEMQDWGVPWREVWPCELKEMDEGRAALLWYAGHFYFGE